MKKTAFLLPAIALLAACGETGSEAEIDMTETPAESVAVEDVDTLPAPDEAKFTEVFAASCEGAEPVSTAICKRGLGSDVVSCEFGLGEDEYMRHEAQLAENEAGDDWMLADAETICAEHGAHHVDS